MQKILVYLLLVFLPIGSFFYEGEKEISSSISSYYQLYDELQLEDMLTYKAFEQAISGHEKIEVSNSDIITIIDFTKPSTEKRLFVIDLKKRELLYSSVVAHGRNSGENYATSFSNENGSYKSSLGFYVTEKTYQGGNGYSLVLNGLEKGINDKAKERAIVMHGADYCNTSITKSGRLGRSFGCPALPHSVNKPIIDAIKGGTLLYIYANNKEYIAKSTILSKEI